MQCSDFFSSFSSNIIEVCILRGMVSFYTNILCLALYVTLYIEITPKTFMAFPIEWQCFYNLLNFNQSESKCEQFVYMVNTCHCKAWIPLETILFQR